MDYTNFYVTHGASADDDNGGAPLGTDDGPVVSRSNCDAIHVSGSTWDIEDKANTGWGATQVGDWGRWDVASAKAVFRVTQLSVGGDDDVIRVLALGTGSLFTAGTGKAVRIGGAFGTVGGALGLIENTIRNADDDPPRINVKADSAYSENPSSAHSGSIQYPIALRGYTSAAGDGGEAEIQGKLTCNHNLIGVEDLYLNAAAAGNSEALEGSGNDILVRNCRARSSGGSYKCISLLGHRAQLVGVRVVDSGYYGIYVQGIGSLILGCTVVSAGSYGIYLYGPYSVADCCVVHGTASSSFRVRGLEASRLSNCLACGSTGGSGLYVPNYGTYGLTILNCIFYGNNQYGLTVQAATRSIIADHNAFGSNSAGDRYGIEAGANDVALGGDPLVDAAGGDFRIDPRTAAGRQLLRAGFPLNINEQAAQVDIGALQADLTAGRGIQIGGRC